MKKQIDNKLIDTTLKHAAEGMTKATGRKNIVMLAACGDNDEPLIYLRPGSKKITVPQLSNALFRLIGKIYNHMELVEHERLIEKSLRIKKKEQK